MKPIYSHTDYRQALREFYESQKAQGKGYTYATFAKKAGLGSPNYLKLVMDGGRSLTPANILAFARGLGLQGAEVEYFEAIVLENQAETPAERRYYSRRATGIRKSAATSVKRKAPTALIEGALKTAMFLACDGKSVDQAAASAAYELDVTPEQARARIGALLGAGELVLDAQGSLRMPARHTMMSDPKGLSERQRRFLQEGLDEGQAVFKARYPEGAAKFLSLLLTAPPGSLDGIFSDVRAALEKACEKFDPAPGQEAGVYRAQLQIYRLRRNEG